MRSPRRGGLIWASGVFLAALAVGTPSLKNGFALDDANVIATNEALHSLSTTFGRAMEPYLAGQLLRPVPMVGFGLQWWAGGGSPLVFRIVSLLLFAFVCVLVFRVICLAGGSARAAGALALVFAVHPVHSEVIANNVGQLELLSTGFVLLAAITFLRARRAERWTREDSAALVGFTFLAIHSKESAYALPAILVLLEVFAIEDSTPLKTRLLRLRVVGLAVVATLLMGILVRMHLLGSAGGGDPHPSLAGMGFPERARAFLLLVPEWTRLLLWPRHLQAEYGPPALDPGAALGLQHLPGLLILLAIAVTLTHTWRRQPMAALGLGWMLAAMLPVANLLFPTGVLVAERTLFLPSVGLTFLGLGAWRHLATHSPKEPGRVYTAAAALAFVAAIVVAGGWRTMQRQGDWADTLLLLRQDAAVAPDTYRLQTMLGQELMKRGDLDGAEAVFQRTLLLWQRDPQPFHDLGQILRIQGRCAEAIPILRTGVAIDTAHDLARSRYIECLIVEQQWDAAEEQIERGLALGVTAYQNALTRVRAGREADSLGAGQPR